MSSFVEFFEATTGFAPHPWQRDLGVDVQCADRLIRIPTGFGKTVGIGVAWLYHRVERGDLAWPTRLVWMLPMRVLVEQTLGVLREIVARAGLEVDVVPCMGGLVDTEYALRPDRPTILVGTQDMLLSRALMRGYAAARGRWPIDFGLLSQDALMVCDEIQLMDAALPTTAQLAAFRASSPSLRPAFTWWMSATLQPEWLATVDHAPRVDALTQRRILIPQSDRRDGLWLNQKALSLRPELAEPAALAAAAVERHTPGTLTLVVVNRVARAVQIEAALTKLAPAAEVRLVHSRFRPHERAGWAEEFLTRSAPMPEGGRFVVATQVVEAGVDFSARLLITDIAPWSSLVQRFGRAGRYPGDAAEVWVVGMAPEADKDARPYLATALQSASHALGRVGSDVGLASLEAFEADLSPSERAALYPPPGGAVLRAVDLRDLFDTTADLSGADIDISPYIRSGDSRDVLVFWRDPPEDGTWPQDLLPRRDELCPVGIGDAKTWLGTLDAGSWWVLDYAEDRWAPGERRRLDSLAPGRTVLVASTSGGYHPRRGFDARQRGAVVPVPEPVLTLGNLLEVTASTGSSDALSEGPGWRTIATHGAETARLVREAGQSLGLDDELTRLLALGGRWHDVGKSHPVFQACLTEEARADLADPNRMDLAKGPRGAWRFAKRKGFRHELASALALLALLRRTAPDHPGLRGDVLDVLRALGAAEADPADLATDPLGQELAGLSSADFDLLLWLVVTHHGKVRSTWASTGHDQRDLARGDVPLQIHGVRDGDRLPGLAVAADGEEATLTLPELVLDLAPSQMGVDPVFGRSWVERAESLLERHGPFALAWLEAMLRAADARASQITSPDPRVSP